MRHLKSNYKLGRTTNHRKALLLNLCRSIIENGAITTTIAKAKCIRPVLEKYITHAKNNTAIPKLLAIFKDLTRIKYIAEKNKDRNGGYLSIIKAGSRKGDNSNMAYIRLLNL